MTALRSDQEAWAMALENEGLANKVCRDFLTRGVPAGIDFDWLKSEAWEGLFNAAKAFDPERGAFSTIAVIAIRNRILRALRADAKPQGGPRGSSGGERVAWISSIEADAEFIRLVGGDDDDGSPEPAYLGVEDPGYEEVEERLDYVPSPWIARFEELKAELPQHHRGWVDQRLDGRQYPDIAADAGVSRQAIHAVFNRLVRQLREEAEVPA